MSSPIPSPAPFCCGAPMREAVARPPIRRWLCPACDYELEVEEQIVGALCRDADDPATDAPPGSEAKILILLARYARRLPLFHPGDNQRSAKAPDPRIGWGSGPAALPRGVSRRTRKDRPAEGFEARAWVEGERVYLGVFDDADVAARAVAQAEAGDVAGAKALARPRR